ncbi:MAG: xanthine dehydrogenase family protein molybdopterin-binding subunit [Pseudomonadota bacterium]|nr:xanthine dehydrogenase family protein molybdopterin-binding subunit [Pseudomonadota bacterium]
MSRLPDLPPAGPILNISRRDTLRALGGGLVVAFALPGLACALEPPDPTVDLGDIPPEGTASHLNAWIRIAPNGVVTLRMPAAEMGQGVYTSLPMILAEELDCDWKDVHAESAPAHPDYGRPLGFLGMESQLTGGSNSVRGYWPALTEAGAAARAMLVAEAAAIWKVDAAACTTQAGAVIHGDKRASYGSLAAGAALRKPPKKLQLKDPASYTLIGTSPSRLDLPSKIDGSAVFGVDVKLEGMVIGTVVPCPHYGGRVGKVDDTKARGMPGVIDILTFDEEVVVLAEHFWQAKKAADALKIEWDPGAGAGIDDAAVEAALASAIAAGGKVIQREGKPSDPPPAGTTTLEATYSAPYLEHATMEPLSAAARVTADRVDIWTGTQIQEMLRSKASKLTKVPKDQVFVHTTFLGGGYGRRSEFDAPRVALQAAMAIDKPVKLIWTREATFARGALRPAARCDLRAVLGPDASGKGTIQHLHVTVAAQSILARFVPGFLANGKMGAMVAVEGLADGPYHFPSIQVDYARVDLPVTVGWWRSVHGSFNGFFRECFLDECAHALGRDPIELRRELLAHNPRFLAVLDLAVAQAGAVPAGQHRGVALFESFGSIVAQVADVTVTDGAVRVHRVTAAIDCGKVVHPDTVKAQVMGATIMGLSMTLHERISLKDAASQERNFHTYPILGPADAPTVDVHIVPSTEPPGGVGEPGLPPVPGAVCNAVFAATGKRLRVMPIAALVG